jgi:hypothetical protein
LSAFDVLKSGTWLQDQTQPTEISVYTNISEFVQQVFPCICSNGFGYGVTVSGVTTPAAANQTYLPQKELYNGKPYFVSEDNDYVIFYSNTLYPLYWVLCAGILPDETATSYSANAAQFIASRFYPALANASSNHGTWAGLTAYVNIDCPYGIDVSLLSGYDESLVLVTGKSIKYKTYPFYPGEAWTAVSLSFEDIVKSLQVIKGCGIDVQLVAGVETLILRDIDDMYLNGAGDEIENVGEVGTDYKVSIWEKAINTIKIGFENKTYSNADDTLEMNMESTYTVGTKIFNRELQMISKIRADKAGIIDIKLGSDKDDDIFFLAITWYPDTSMYGFKYGGVKKISDPTISSGNGMNQEITPQHCLETNKNLIASLCYAGDGERLYLTKKTITNKEGNSKANPMDMKTAADFGMPENFWKAESEGLLVQSGTKIFMPIIVEFTAAISETFMANYKLHDKGYISFTIDGNEYKGFIIKLKYKPTGKTKCTFTLLSAPDNDLTKLIR